MSGLVCGYHRKHAIRKLNQPLPDKPMRRRSTQRGLTDAQVLGVLKAVWEAADCPWLIRLKALLNLTDIYTGWVETRVVMGKGEGGIVAALDEMRAVLQFALQAIDSDNGSEFINAHLWRYCQQHRDANHPGIFGYCVIPRTNSFA